MEVKKVIGESNHTPVDFSQLPHISSLLLKYPNKPINAALWLDTYGDLSHATCRCGVTITFNTSQINATYTQFVCISCST
jgi:hypothetical protein